MPVVHCNEILEQGAGESILHAIDFTPWLRKPAAWQEGTPTAALLTGTPTIIDQAAVLTLGSKAVNTAVVVKRHNLEEIPIGQGVQFRASGGVAGTRYTIKTTIADADSNTWECYAKLQIV